MSSTISELRLCKNVKLVFIDSQSAMLIQKFIFNSITFLALIIGASPLFLKLYFTSTRYKLFCLLWWIYSISIAVWFTMISIDTIFSDWDSNLLLVSNIAITGVTFGEYTVRVMVRFMCLVKFGSIQEFGLYLYNYNFNETHKNHLGLHVKKLCDHNFFKISYILTVIICCFNVRMEYKADLEYFRAYSPTEIQDKVLLKSFTNVAIIQKIVSYSHDITQVILLNLFYFFSIHCCHLIYLKIGIITEVLIIDEEFTKSDSNASIFSPQFERLCHQLRKIQNYTDKAISWFLLIIIPSSIVIPMIQLYKVVVGFDSDLYYSQWESAGDVIVYLIRIWTLSTSGYLIQIRVKDSYKRMRRSIVFNEQALFSKNTANSLIKPNTDHHHFLASQKCWVLDVLINWKWRLTAAKFFDIDRHLIAPIISTTITNIIVLFEIKDIVLSDSQEIGNSSEITGQK